MRIDWRQSRWDLLVLAITCAVICVVVPAYVVASSPADFSLWPGSFRAVAALIFALAFVSLAPLYLLAVFTGGRRWAAVSIWVLLAWACTAGVAIPISQSVELVSPADTPIAPFRLVLALAMTVMAGWLAATGRQRIVAIYLTVQMAVALVPVAPGLWTAFAGRGAPPVIEFVTLSARQNILVVSFDDISGALAQEALRENPELAKSFADFTFFRNAFSNSPGTVLSTHNEMFGARDYKAIANTLPELIKRSDLNALPLNEPELDAAGYGAYARFAMSGRRRVEFEELGGKPDLKISVAEVMGFYENVWVRLGTRFAVRLLAELGRHSANPLFAVSRLLDTKCSACDPLGKQLREHHGAIWDLNSLNTLRDFDAFVARAKTGTSPFALRYMHFQFTHFPVDFDESCQYRASSAAWFIANQNNAGAMGETVCALRKFAALLTRLQQIGAYDSSLIVLQSDHGKQAVYFDKPPGNIAFAGTKEWGYDRYRPLIMIKSVQQHGQSLAVSDRVVAISDLATTLCRRIPGKRRCDVYPGVDILAQQEANEPDFYVYLPKDAGASHRLETLESVRLRRGQDLLAVARK